MASEVYTMSDSAEEVIKDMKRRGLEWSEVCDWITRQIGYDTNVVEWARRIYNNLEV